MKRGTTVRLYDVKTSKKSLASRLRAASHDIRMPNPTKPTAIMANDISIPVRKSKRTAIRPIIPTVTSLILTSRYFHDVGQEHQALHKTTDCKGVSDGIERQVAGQCDLARAVDSNPSLRRFQPIRMKRVSAMSLVTMSNPARTAFGNLE